MCTVVNRSIHALSESSTVGSPVASRSDSSISTSTVIPPALLEVASLKKVSLVALNLLWEWCFVSERRPSVRLQMGNSVLVCLGMSGQLVNYSE